MKKILLIDFSAIAHATLHICIHDPKLKTQEDLISFWSHTILSSILNKKEKIKPDEVVLCLDRRSWRDKEFKYYKAERKLEKSKSDVDYDFFFKHLNEFTDNIRNIFPWKVISYSNAEGDDIIAILTHELSKENEVVIVSGDKDLKQLLKLDNVSYYSYRNDDFETLDNAHEFLLRLILGGDSSDGIPNIASQDNIFILEGKRQKAFGPKKIDKVLIQGVDEFLDENPEYKEKFERNKKLIELSEKTIPEDIWKSVVDKYYNYSSIKFSFVKILKFLHDNKLNRLREKINLIE